MATDQDFKNSIIYVILLESIMEKQNKTKELKRKKGIEKKEIYEEATPRLITRINNFNIS